MTKPTHTMLYPTGTTASPTLYHDTVTPVIRWSFSDPDGSAQSSIQIHLYDGDTIVWDSGEIDPLAAQANELLSDGLLSLNNEYYYSLPTTANIQYNKTYGVLIRVKDSTGEWSDYTPGGSNTYFMINRAPLAINLGTIPAALPPLSVITDNLVPQFIWTYSDADSGASQAAYRIQIYDDTALIYDVTVTGSATSHTIPSGVLMSGKKYKWSVMVKDNRGAWGSFATFKDLQTNTHPGVPINPTPSGGSAAFPAQVENRLNPTVSWTFVDPDTGQGDSQASFQVRLYNDTGTMLHDSGEVTTPVQSYQIPYKLKYKKVYQWEVRTKDKYGSWSSYTTRNWMTPMVGAPKNVIILPDNENGLIRFTWDPSDADDLAGYNIFRSEKAGGPYEKLNTYLITEAAFDDTFVGTDKKYYYVLQVQTTEGYVSPDTMEWYALATFNNWFIGYFGFDGPTSFNKKRSRRQSRRSTLGSKRSVIQDRGFDGEEIQMEIIVDGEEYDELIDELEQMIPVGVRDPFGRSWKVVPGSFDDDQLLTGKLQYRVKVDLTEVD